MREWHGRETFPLKKCGRLFLKGLSRAEIVTTRSKESNGEKYPVPEIPTPDEWLRYAVNRIKDDGQEGLLRQYLIW